MRLLAQAQTGVDQIFGTISPPPQLKDFTSRGGAGGISFFLSNLVALIFAIGGIVFVLMLLWGALGWIISGGQKEGLETAQKRITHALVGIVLLSVSFALLEILGKFLGFEFFTGFRGYPGQCSGNNPYLCNP